jgi:hypothetical protein
MNESERSKLHEMIVEFVELYCELIRVNRRIGIWDTRRHDVCKADVKDIDVAYLAKTERLGRFSVEKRAQLKTRVDALFAEIVELRTQRAAGAPIANEAYSQ